MQGTEERQINVSISHDMEVIKRLSDKEQGEEGRKYEAERYRNVFKKEEYKKQGSENMAGEINASQLSFGIG